VLTVASKLIPKRATEALQEKGIDINELIELSKKPDAQGTIIEVEEHKKKEKIIIALE
jgi:aspartokinase